MRKTDQYDEAENIISEAEPAVKLRVGDPGNEPESAPLAVARSKSSQNTNTQSEPVAVKVIDPTRDKLYSFLRFIGIPAGLWIYSYTIGPGFVVPFLNHPIARTVGLGLLTWLIIGGVIYCQSKGFFSKLLCVVVFMMPAITPHIWIPMAITIFNAVRPAFGL